MTCSKEDGDEVTERDTVIVGMKLDAGSRELLTWALANFAGAGDRVIALHVILTDVKGSSEWNPASLISIIKGFDAMISSYEGFCNLKQVDLKMKICRGSSIRKTLTQEAISASASKVVVGVHKNYVSLGSSSLAVAKYCAKKLSRGCSILAVNNGKIIYEKNTAGNKSRLFRKEGNDCKTSSSFDSLDSEELSIDEAIFKPSFSPDTDSQNPILPEFEKKMPSREVQAGKDDNPSPDRAIHETSDSKPGWFLLRNTVVNSRKNWSQTRSKSSVVKWVMRLPSLYYATSAVHPYHSRSKSELYAKSGEENNIPEELLSPLKKYSSLCSVLSFSEVLQATSNFSPDNIIGKGGSCRVYKGRLRDGRELAFKALKCLDNLLSCFISEIAIIISLRHKNIISLYGFCYESSHLVSVYDFLSRGSLEENLHGVKADKIALGWTNRYKIAVGVAEALDYLHNDRSREPVIHRDVKSSNILLSHDFQPKLCDFGLAQWASSSSIQNDEARDCSDLAGTFGYLAPEYFMFGDVDAKIDVYAFGVVLLELLSGRMPVCPGRPKGEESLAKWAKPILEEEKFDQLVDPSLGDDFDRDEMVRMCLTASLCLRQASHSRPSSALALALLKGEDEAVEWARSELMALTTAFEDSDDESVILHSNIQSHINLALLDVEEEDEETALGAHQEHSFLQSNTSLEEYLKARNNRSLSF